MDESKEKSDPPIASDVGRARVVAKSTDDTASNSKTNDSDSCPTETGSSKVQFGIAALFWTTFLVGLTIAYLQRLDSPDILIDAFFAIVLGVIIGSVVGFVTKKFGDAIFWATLIAAFGYISTASDPVYISYHRLAWAVVGAVSGAIAATIFTKHIWGNLISSAIGAGLAMAGYYSLAKNLPNSADLTFDVFGAPVIGAAIAILIRIVLWIEQEQKTPRYITATWLLIAVVIGNAMAH